MSLIAPTQITAVATSVLAFFAIVTAAFTILAFRKQSDEVGMLQQDRQREAEQRRRAQVAQVFTWVGERPVHDGEAPRPAACVRNTSRQPVHDIRVGWGSSGVDTWRVLLPDEENAIPGAGSSVAGGTVPIRIEFRDVAGVRWRATSNGELTRPDRALNLVRGRLDIAPVGRCGGHAGAVATLTTAELALIFAGTCSAVPKGT